MLHFHCIGNTISGDTSGALYETWVYDSNKNAWGTDASSGNLSDYINTTVTATLPESTSTDMSAFLQNKIGYHNDKDGKNYGMCMSVLNKCQDITYTGTGQNLKYNAANNVVKEFLQRTLIQIKSAQDAIVADYAESCISDVSSCLAQNNYDADKNEDSEMSSGNKLAVNACKSIITTCMSVNGAVKPNTDDVKKWINGIFSDKRCPAGAVGVYPDCECASPSVYLLTQNICITCPNKANYGSDTTGIYPNCGCKEDYKYNKSTNMCVYACPADAKPNDSNTGCICLNSGYGYNAIDKVCQKISSPTQDEDTPASGGDEGQNIQS